MIVGDGKKVMESEGLSSIFCDSLVKFWFGLRMRICASSTGVEH